MFDTLDNSVSKIDGEEIIDIMVEYEYGYVII